MLEAWFFGFFYLSKYARGYFNYCKKKLVIFLFFDYYRLNIEEGLSELHKHKIDIILNFINVLLIKLWILH